ncbi:ornithine cyclodeaminase family protein [Pseudomonas sp. NA-150]|uniref:ornithine cyclodeaminase family protein n=1 Tax=Pseudomonas sp. NA-150 TaxID=3367525 RepID=UPI0037C83D2F
MNSQFPTYGLSELRTALLRKDMLSVVRDAFIRHAQSGVVAPEPGELLFSDPPGDCHIKFGYFKGGAVFVVKLAIGFYENPMKGLDTNNGLVLVFDAKTGKTIAVLNDEGWLTSWRTAAAGALAAKAGAPSSVTALGIIGTGHQAELQARWASESLGTQRVVIWGRDLAKSARLANNLSQQGLTAMAVKDVGELFAQCNVVITCTPATAPLVPAAMVRPGTHIVAMGADSVGKQELDPNIFARATVIMTDDHAQCLGHGEFCHAVTAGLVSSTADISLGQVLAGQARGRLSEEDITIVDLTGLAAQDVAIATLAIELIQSRSIEGGRKASEGTHR